MGLMARLRGLLPARAPATAVDLSPSQQIVLLALRRSGPRPYAALAREIAAQRFYAPPADAASGILTLERAGLIVRMGEDDPSPAGRRYRLSRRGRKALRVIPPEPRSVMQLWV